MGTLKETVPPPPHPAWVIRTHYVSVTPSLARIIAINIEPVSNDA